MAILKQLQSLQCLSSFESAILTLGMLNISLNKVGAFRVYLAACGAKMLQTPWSITVYFVAIVPICYLLFVYRSKWDVIRLLQLFLEHVLQKQPFDNSVAYLIRLELVRWKKPHIIYSMNSIHNFKS